MPPDSLRVERAATSAGTMPTRTEFLLAPSAAPNVKITTSRRYRQRPSALPLSTRRREIAMPSVHASASRPT